MWTSVLKQDIAGRRSAKARKGINRMKVLILHFRSAPKSEGSYRSKVDVTNSAGTDGVSLEMMKREGVLKEMGHEVDICSGCDWADFPIPGLEFDSEGVMRMTRNLFGETIADYSDEVELENAFGRAVDGLKRELSAAVKASKPDVLFVHNMLCLPVHPVATVSLAELLADLRLPCVAIHHDVLSEGAYKFRPTCGFARSLLDGFFPPKLPNLSHWTINTRNRKALESRNVKAGLIHDSMDFDHRLDESSHTRIRKDLRTKHGIKSSDIVLFVGARIVPNKQIELAAHIAAELIEHRPDFAGKALYNGEVFTEEGRIILVLAGRPERGFVKYKEAVFSLLDTLKVDWMYVGDEVFPLRVVQEGFYALYDMYAMADFVLYPSGWEGFGNQLLETFAAGLPAVVFEYPVYKEDIGPKGVEVISLGDRVLEERDSAGLVRLPIEVSTQAVEQIITLLTDQGEYKRVTDHNIAIGKRYWGYETLRAHLSEGLRWASTRSFQ
jgi:glycosyltransferase involved in cell wall biosynthesis